MGRISWHPAFVQAIQLELEEYHDVLTFETEYQLTTEPLKIDVLIIKKTKDVVIKKNIAQIFRQFNVVEYKSPADRATIADYHKTQCYARLYAVLNKKDIDDISVTVVATRHPRKLLTFLKKRYAVQHAQSGIYLVEGDTCPTQIVVSEELSEEDNLWLNGLRSDLSANRLEKVAITKKPKLPIDAYIYVIGEANIKAMEELYMRKKKGVILSEMLDAHFREKWGDSLIAQGVAQGVAQGEAMGEARGVVIGEARGEARGKAEAGRKLILAILRRRFGNVPKNTERTILAMNDPIALESWGVQAATCETLKEFVSELQ
jgi:hypothetical protein